jgi:hypothetical protein
MKSILFTFLLTGTFSLGFAQVQMPQPSPTQYIKQDFGMSSIELTYSRPGLKGRSIIGVVEPWNVVWRTGANASTKIRFNDPVEILGHKIDSGTYALYTIPQKNGAWTFILNKGVTNWGADGYKQSEDVMRATVKAGKNPGKVETLTMQFSDMSFDKCVLNIKWEDFSLRIPITVSIKDRIRAQIEAALQTDKKPYWQAAQFYNEHDKNYEKALTMMNALLAQTKSPAYYIVYYKALIQKNMGDKKGALITSNESLALAKAAKNTAYIQLNEKLQKELKK